MKMCESISKVGHIFLIDHVKRVRSFDKYAFGLLQIVLPAKDDYATVIFKQNKIGRYVDDKRTLLENTMVSLDF